jgi:hypothetical protein
MQWPVHSVSAPAVTWGISTTSLSLMSSLILTPLSSYRWVSRPRGNLGNLKSVGSLGNEWEGGREAMWEEGKETVRE